MPACNLCPRGCGVDRAAGQKGFCGVAGAKIKVARAGASYVGGTLYIRDKGSGTVFFSGCPLRCGYCQNREIARGGAGKRDYGRAAVRNFLELQEKGAENINLVTPTHLYAGGLSALQRGPGMGGLGFHRLQLRRNMRRRRPCQMLEGGRGYLSDRF